MHLNDISCRSTSTVPIQLNIVSEQTYYSYILFDQKQMGDVTCLS